MNFKSLLRIVLFSFVSIQLFPQSYSSADMNALLAIDATCDVSNRLNWNNEPDPARWDSVRWIGEDVRRVYYLNICGKSLTGILDLSPLTELKDIRCCTNQLTGINLTGLINLESLICYENLLTELDVTHLTKLVTLSCVNNQISVLDVLNLTNLNGLYCGVNNISVLDVSGLTNLTDLHCSGNQIDILDVSDLVLLTRLSCYDNNISELDVSDLVNLYELNCTYNNISELDLADLTNLIYLNCAFNRISSLELDGLTLLETLHCGDNQISNLDVSHLTNLDILGCWNNSLTDLDVSACTNLTSLYCNDNELTELDVSMLYDLELFECNNNQLTVIDVSASNNLSLFDCHLNTLPFTSLSTGLHTSDDFYYNPQDTLYSPLSYTYNITINYSDQALIRSTATNFIFYRNGVPVETNTTGQYTTQGSGVYNCEMTNGLFPDLTLITAQVTIIYESPKPAVITDVIFENPLRCGETGTIVINLNGSNNGDLYNVDYNSDGVYENSDTSHNNSIILSNIPDGTEITALSIIHSVTNQHSSSLLTGIIQSPDLPEVTLTGTHSYCSNDQAIPVEGGSPEGGEYRFDGEPVTRIEPHILAAGPHQLVYTYTDEHNCTGSDTVSVVISEAPPAGITGEQNLCPGTESSIYYTVQDNQFEYTWNVDGGNYTIGSQPSEITVQWLYNTQGSVDLIVHDALTQCSSHSNLIVNLTDTEAPQINNCMEEYHVRASYGEDGYYYILGSNDRIIIPQATDNCQDADLIYTYLFNEEYHDIAEFSGYRIAGVEQNYIIWKVSDNSGNTSTCTTIIVLETENTIPTAFSPNGDEYNNTWNIRMLRQYPDCIVKVFNRWGILIYESERGYPVSWDGRKQDKLVPVDTYYYVITLENSSEPLKGYVTVLY